ncbi:MAG: hypothetical protein QHH06_10240 [Clostridiales bacterium]|jgi:K+-sensing histidine kinase KdpD|nr:hypothetical protein [Eubacteriales bacterium]MDH7566844.1 hypothetical protein [Clostridiales bacterium]
MSENEVTLKAVCEEKHKAIDEKFERDERRLNDHSDRIGTVEDAVIKLTAMVEEIKKKDFFDKLLILCVFIMVIVVAAMVLGPEITGKIVGGGIR